MSRTTRVWCTGLVVAALTACNSSGDNNGGNVAGFSGGTAGTIAGSGAGSGVAGDAVAAGSGAGVGAGASGVGAGAGGVGGASGTGDPDAGMDVDAGPKLPNSDPKYMNLAPPMGTPLDGQGTTLSPAAPDGWIWYEIEGAMCRDGSKTGFFVHDGTANKLLIFLEGGGACSNDHYCAFNPANSSSSLAGTGQTVIGSTLGSVMDRQQPGVYVDGGHKAAPAGIHDLSNPMNPFKDWSQVYIPYCTGDVFFGTNENGNVPGLMGQKFVGYNNMKLFISHIVPTYKPKVDHVVLAGSSAGSFGAALNFSMVQDSFGEVQVDGIMDSGVPFTDKYMPVCMQMRWRAAWGLNAALPSDCKGCFNSDGGGLLGLADFLLDKHPNANLALLSGTQDEVMRLFFSSGLADCKNYDTADPVAVVLGQFDPTVYFPAADYTAGLNEMVGKYKPSGRFATYLIGGANPNFHEHLFRPEFYTSPSGSGPTEAAFIADFINHKITQVGP